VDSAAMFFLLGMDAAAEGSFSANKIEVCLHKMPTHLHGYLAKN
jgi:hypothetical protein